MWGCLIVLVLIILVLWAVMRESAEPFNATHNVFLGGSSSWELNPEWENCAPCFAQCARDQWTGKIQPEMGETNKDICARKCARYCQGFAYRWPDSIHVGFKKHGM